jgi:hypothetical protein
MMGMAWEDDRGWPRLLANRGHPRSAPNSAAVTGQIDVRSGITNNLDLEAVG